MGRSLNFNACAELHLDFSFFANISFFLAARNVVPFVLFPPTIGYNSYVNDVALQLIARSGLNFGPPPLSYSARFHENEREKVFFTPFPYHPPAVRYTSTTAWEGIRNSFPYIL